MPNEVKQLKKSDLLKVVTETPMTRKELVDSLDDYGFIASYLDYLIEHFKAQGKIIENEDGTIQRKAKKSSGSREAFRVTEDEDGSYIEQKALTGLLSGDEKDAGWSTTQGAAIKKACSAVFQNYKDTTTVIKELKDSEPRVAKEADEEADEEA